jgi:enoyl reductase-like protein
VLSAEDYDAWLEDCRSGGKPVPFVPVVDGDLEVWFKKVRPRCQRGLG